MPDLDSLARQVNLIQRDLDNLKRVVRDIANRQPQGLQQHNNANSPAQRVNQQRTSVPQHNTKQPVANIKPNVEIIKPQTPQTAQPQTAQQTKEADVPGIEGIFDGYSMILDNGSTLVVPPNYAAKSRLVYGDRLRMVDENGVSVFKQVQKVPRKLITGILDKTGSNWFLLTEDASYSISSNAAEYNKATPHCEAEAFIPESNPDVPFATLERVIMPNVPNESGTTTSPSVSNTVNTVVTQQSGSVATIATQTVDSAQPVVPVAQKKPLDPKVLYEDDLR